MEFKDCYQVAAGKNATKDGSVLVARSLDSRGGDDPIQIKKIPRKAHSSSEKLEIPWTGGVKISQPAITYAYVGLMVVVEGIEMDEANGGINEHQVSISSSNGCMNPEAQNFCEKMPGSIGDFRMNLVLERCKTAKEGIELIGRMTENYGARTDNYIVGDPNEVWTYEEYRDRLWAALRVPDDCFVIQANSVRIDRVNYDDPDNFVGAKNLVDFAVENGLYDPDRDGPLNPSVVYGDQSGKIVHGIPAPEYDRRRIWRGINYFAPSLNLDPIEPCSSYPLFVKPDRKITPQDVLNLLADRYEGTDYDNYERQSHLYVSDEKTSVLTSNLVEDFNSGISPQSINYVDASTFRINKERQYQLSPAWGKERNIGTSRAIANWCAQLRGWMPDPIGGVFWAGLGEAATVARVPWYVGIRETPEAFNKGTRIPETTQYVRTPNTLNVYDPDSAYWAFRIVTNLVNLFYTATKDEVIPIWRRWERRNFRMQPLIEKVALELFETDEESALEFLTTYCSVNGLESLLMAEKMVERLHSVIARFNSPI